MKSDSRPAVVIWIKMYAVVMLLVQGAITAFFARVAIDPVPHIKGDIAYQNNPDAAVAMLVFFCSLFSLIFGACIPFLLAVLVWPRRQSAWIVGILGLVAGFLTSCGWVAAIPLFIFWMKPDAKAYYGIHSKGKSDLPKGYA